MVVYYIVIVGMVLLAGIDMQISPEFGYEVRYRKPQKFVAFLMIAMLAVVAGLRYNVGTDYYNYYASYRYFKMAPLAINDEPGIKVIARIAAVIYDDPGTMMFLAAVITVVLMAGTVIKNSELYWLSILLYILLGCWHGCFNGVRQYLAAAVLFAGHPLIRQEKFKWWCVIVALASMFHVTAVIGIIFYFFPKLKISVKQVFLSIVAIYIGLQAYEKIFSFIEVLKDDTFDFEGVGAGYLTSSINPLRIAVAWVPVAFFWLFNQYYDKENEKLKFYVNMTLLHAVFMTAAINSTYLGRVGIYTGAYNTLTWPLLIKKVEPRSQKLLILMMLAFYFLYWLTEASGPTLSEFHWLFQR